MSNKEISIGFTGNFDPSVITNILGIAPLHTEMLGDVKHIEYRPEYHIEIMKYPANASLWYIDIDDTIDQYAFLQYYFDKYAVCQHTEPFLSVKKKVFSYSINCHGTYREKLNGQLLLNISMAFDFFDFLFSCTNFKCYSANDDVANNSNKTAGFDIVFEDLHNNESINIFEKYDMEGLCLHKFQQKLEEIGDVDKLRNYSVSMYLSADNYGSFTLSRTIVKLCSKLNSFAVGFKCVSCGPRAD
jgi:hypothetical protein